MRKFKNVSPLGALELPLVGRVVAHGEVIEVTPAQAVHLAGQADWEPADPKPKRRRQDAAPDQDDAADGVVDDEREE
ncbi:hypothetical protein [Cellulosimicrobium sp. JZ28]|uniref:hypothetical protein n=1 Tax=Cellulosimicrobium sp. JZ28 TaxID=1906273 RepID=UPI00188BFD45|nr:hypothetical protein [Cellulosimicrobium sp. JZ28]